ncbi:MAG: glycosyltransferase family 4 protein [Bacteroidota bacterium]|nr:glycosyltransferase family 4 protein [Bacteroidota bacterium]
MNSNMVWGGGEKWHYETACHFRDLGYAVMVIANKESELYHKLEDHEGILLESVRIRNRSFFNPFKLFRIRLLLKKHAISAILLGLPIDLKLGGLAARYAGIKNIIYRRGAAVPIKNSFLNRFLFGTVLTSIITNSKEIRDKIFQTNPRIIDEKKVHIIYNGVNLQHWSGRETSTRDDKNSQHLILGNAGRLVEQKGQNYLIRIAQHLKEKQLDFKLFIAGAGKFEQSLKHDCFENKLENEIVFLDFVENMPDFLAGLDIYLSTSIHEGSSHVIIEAMAAGKPVIAFDVSSMPELIENEKTGFLIPFADTQLFAEKIVFLKNNKIVLDNFGANARKRVQRKFDFNKNMSQVFELIKEKQ